MLRPFSPAGPSSRIFTLTFNVPPPPPLPPPSPLCLITPPNACPAISFLGVSRSPLAIPVPFHCLRPRHRRPNVPFFLLFRRGSYCSRNCVSVSKSLLYTKKSRPSPFSLPRIKSLPEPEPNWGVEFIRTRSRRPRHPKVLPNGRRGQVKPLRRERQASILTFCGRAGGGAGGRAMGARGGKGRREREGGQAGARRAAARYGRASRGRLPVPSRPWVR